MPWFRLCKCNAVQVMLVLLLATHTKPSIHSLQKGRRMPRLENFAGPLLNFATAGVYS